MTAVLGQERALHVLREAMRHRHVSHAWIFHGPYGVGKFTAAAAFARLLLDPEATDESLARFDPPQGTETAQLVERGLHPDLHIIRRTLAAVSDNPTLRSKRLSNIPIDLLREFMIGGECGDGRFREAPVFKSAVMGHAKVFIVEESELLDFVGQNALLKTLEEPPAHTYIVLLTTRVDRLLPTIRSRCQRVPFARLDEDSMRRWMQRHRLALEGDAERWALALADGSPGTAVFAARHDLHRWAEELGPEFDRLAQGEYAPKLGDMLARRVDELAKALVKERESKVSAPEDDEGEGESDAGAAAGDGQPRTKASKQSANHEAAGWLAAVLGHVARQRLHECVRKGHDPSFWLELVDLVGGAERAVHSNLNLKHVFANLVTQAADRAAMHRVGSAP